VAYGCPIFDGVAVVVADFKASEIEGASYGPSAFIAVIDRVAPRLSR
jgi:hypothetical protein